MRQLLLALAGLIELTSQATAEVPRARPVGADLHVTSDALVYGVLIGTTADPACPAARYRVDVGALRVVSRATGQGGLVIVRLGAGLPLGPQRLKVTPLGCAAAPNQVRRVIFGKSSPDHGWRSAPGLTDVEGDALSEGQG